MYRIFSIVRAAFAGMIFLRSFINIDTAAVGCAIGVKPLRLRTTRVPVSEVYREKSGEQACASTVRRCPTSDNKIRNTKNEYHRSFPY
jgi:hypothetical protein